MLNQSTIPDRGLIDIVRVRTRHAWLSRGNPLFNHGRVCRLVLRLRQGGWRTTDFGGSTPNVGGSPPNGSLLELKKEKGGYSITPPVKGAFKN